MNRKLIGAVVALVVAALAVWLLWLRDRGDARATHERTGSARSGELPTASKTPTPEPAPPAPRGAAPTWSLDVDPQGTLLLEGQVLGPDGSGVGGAKVWLGSVPARSTTTEDDGTFSFDKLVGRTYPLTASRGKLIGGPVSHKLSDGSPPVVIRLGEGATVIVTVVDDQDKPIQGADVEESDDVTAKTDAQGKATLTPVRPGWVGVEAKAEGYAPGGSFTTVGSAGATAELTITLKQGYAVSGKVVDEAGKPVAQAKVRASTSMWGITTGDSESAITDPEGKFTIKALAAGSHTLSAIDGEHAPARSSPITVAERPITGIVITMKAGGVFAGTVVTADGKPAPFATVKIAGKGGQDAWQAAAPRQATTDDAGAFEVRGLARVAMQARAESALAASQIVDVDLSTRPTITDGRLVLDVTGQIAGTVVDELGTPLPEVQVNAFPDILGGAKLDGIALAGMSSATTDGAGAFVVTGLPEGAYRLWAARAAAGFQEWGQQGVSATTGDRAVKIVLASSGELVGKLVLADGKEPALASVQVGQKPPTPVTKGAIVVRDLAPGSYDVTLRGAEFAETIKHDIKIEPGKTTDLGTVTVQRGRRLVGKVVDRNGPVPDAKVRVGEMLFTAEGGDDRMDNLEELAGIRSAVTDQHGEFAIIGIAPKGLTVMADHADRGRSIGVPLAMGTDDPPPVTLTLKGYGSITGTVTMKGKPQPKVTISASSKGGGATATFSETDTEGRFTISKVPEGAIVLQAMVSQMMTMKSTTVTATVVAGRETKVAIDIPVGEIALVVEIKPQAGAQVDAAQVFLFNGVVAATDAKQLTDGFFQGGAQGMKFWLGKSLPFPEFDELVPGGYSVCSIPITGDLSEPKFQGRLQQNMAALKVYCKQVKIRATPVKQTFVHDLPSMTPLPEPTN